MSTGNHRQGPAQPAHPRFLQVPPMVKMARASACTQWEAWVQHQRTQQLLHQSQPQQRYPWPPLDPGPKNLGQASQEAYQHPLHPDQSFSWPALPAILAHRNTDWGGLWVAPRLSGSQFNLFNIFLNIFAISFTRVRGVLKLI